jgi:hypothetical protein
MTDLRVITRDGGNRIIEDAVEEMVRWPVSTRVGKVRNNDASLIEPVALSG